MNNNRESISSRLTIGESLTINNTSGQTEVYNYIMVLGGANDTVTITLNGTQMELPAGTSISVVVKTLTVDRTVTQALTTAGDPIVATGSTGNPYANSISKYPGVMVYGFRQYLYMFN